MPRGHLVIRVKEANGKNRRDEIVWEPNFYEGFVRAELRGPDRNHKTIEQSSTKRVLANQISWDEELRLEVNDQSKELRLMLCREKRSNTRVGTAVIAACGIFVNDILGAVPINKYFELFKPRATSNAEGGFIRVSITFEDHSRRPSKSAGQGQRSEEVAGLPTQVSLDTDGLINSVAEEQEVPGRHRLSNLGDVQEEHEIEEEDLPSETELDQERDILSHKSAHKKGNSVVKAGLFVVAAAGISAAVFLSQNKKLGKKDKNKT